MERWTCPKCKRQFGKKGQGHMCSPGLTLDEYFATAEPWERPIFDKVSAHIEQLGDVIVDPLSIGIRFKNGPLMCELRAMKKWTAVGFSLRRRVTSGRLSRKVVDHNGKYFHVINIDTADKVDDELLSWLTEAFHVAGGTSGAESPVGSSAESPGSMVPDDIEDPFA